MRDDAIINDRAMIWSPLSAIVAPNPAAITTYQLDRALANSALVPTDSHPFL